MNSSSGLMSLNYPEVCRHGRHSANQGSGSPLCSLVSPLAELKTSLTYVSKWSYMTVVQSTLPNLKFSRSLPQAIGSQKKACYHSCLQRSRQQLKPIIPGPGLSFRWKMLKHSWDNTPTEQTWDIHTKFACGLHLRTLSFGTLRPEPFVPPAEWL